jgi:putative transposase
VIDDMVGAEIRTLGEAIAQSFDICFLEYNHDRDHIHVLFKASPSTELSKFIGVFKSSTARNIRSKFPLVKRQLWGNAFWSPSFCLLTTGGAPLDTLTKYIQSQGTRGALP